MVKIPIKQNATESIHFINLKSELINIDNLDTIIIQSSQLNKIQNDKSQYRTIND